MSCFTCVDGFFVVSLQREIKTRTNMGKLLRKIARCTIECAIDSINESIEKYEEAKHSVVKECVDGIVPLLEDCPICGDISDYEVLIRYEDEEYFVECVYLNKDKEVLIDVDGISGLYLEYRSINEITEIASRIVEIYNKLDSDATRNVSL